MTQETVPHPMDIKINRLPGGSLFHATSFPSSSPSFPPPSNLSHPLGTPALLPGNLGNPRLGNLGCSCRQRLPHFDHLEPLQAEDSTWRQISVVPGRSSARSGWLRGCSPSAGTWCCCHTCLCTASGRKWHAVSLEQSSQPVVETQKKENKKWLSRNLSWKKLRWTPTLPYYLIYQKRI